MVIWRSNTQAAFPSIICISAGQHSGIGANRKPHSGESVLMMFTWPCAFSRYYYIVQDFCVTSWYCRLQMINLHLQYLPVVLGPKALRSHQPPNTFPRATWSLILPPSDPACPSTSSPSRQHCTHYISLLRFAPSLQFYRTICLRTWWPPLTSCSHRCRTSESLDTSCCWRFGLVSQTCDGELGLILWIV